MAGLYSVGVLPVFGNPWTRVTFEFMEIAYGVSESVKREILIENQQRLLNCDVGRRETIKRIFKFSPQIAQKSDAQLVIGTG